MTRGAMKVIYQSLYPLRQLGQVWTCAPLVALAMASAAPAGTTDWEIASGHVIRLEATYMPDAITFQVDQDAGNCPAGVFLRWNSQGPDEAEKIANGQAVYAMLLTSEASGHPVTLYGDNAGCVVMYIHMIP